MSILLAIASLVALCVYVEIRDHHKKHRDEKLVLDSRRLQANLASKKKNAVRPRVGLLDAPDISEPVARNLAAASFPSAQHTSSPPVTQPLPTSDVKHASTAEIDELMKRCSHLDELISRRFNSGELTATRYRLVLDEVRLGMLSNLDRQARLRSTVQHLTRAEEEAAIVAAATDAERQMHHERLLLLDDVDVRIDRMVVANRQALHTLDQAIVTLTDFVGEDGHSNMRLAASLKDLQALVAQVHKTASGVGDAEEIELSLGPKKKKRKPITPGAS